MNNILDTVKKLAGVSMEDDSFNLDLIIFINSTLSILSQMGVDEADATPVIDENTTWEDLLGDRTDLEMVKTYLHLKTKLLFDPPTNSAALAALKESIAEYEWRINNLKTIKGVLTNE